VSRIQRDTRGLCVLLQDSLMSNLHELVVTQRVSLACDETRRCTGKDIDWKKPAVLAER
jgi:hypothetical protein